MYKRQNIDGVKFLNHHGGCGGTRDDANTLGKLLAAYANHPNVGGITILSLGCQHLQTKILQDDIQLLNPEFDKPVPVSYTHLDVYKRQPVMILLRDGAHIGLAA